MPTSSPRRGPGRRPSTSEGKTAKVNAYFTPTQLELVLEAQMNSGKDMSEFIRDLTLSYLESDAHWADAGTNQFRAPLLPNLPCGPWTEGVEDAKNFAISEDLHDFLETRDNDIFATCRGNSMEGAGILDGDIVVLRPLDGKLPRRGEIVQVNIETADGENLSTLKRWDGQDGQLPRLLDGRDEPFTLPDGAIAATPYARAIGRWGRL